MAGKNPETQHKEMTLKNWFRGKKNFDGGIIAPNDPNGWKAGDKKLNF